MANYLGQALPFLWGPNLIVATHLGSVTYTVSYNALGDTQVIGPYHIF